MHPITELPAALRSVCLLSALVMLPIAAAWASASDPGLIDFAKGDSQATNESCRTFTLANMKDGQAYSLFVRGTVSSTCSFNARGLNIEYPSNYGATTTGTHTLFSFQRFGSDVVVGWATGY